MKTAKRSRIQWFILALGLIGTLFYFLHVIIGSMHYSGYDPIKQAVSDLTAVTAPSRGIASALSQIYGVFIVSLCALLCVFYETKESKAFRLGIYLLTAMQGVTAIGYTLFPLSASGFRGDFQDSMHVVVTVLVVLLSISSMVLIALGSFRHKAHKRLGMITLITLGLMCIGSAGVGALPDILGVAERFSVYSVVLYGAVLSVFTYKHVEKGVQK